MIIEHVVSRVGYVPHACSRGYLAPSLETLERAGGRCDERWFDDDDHHHR